MPSNQGDRQAAVRAETGTALNYEGDYHALFTLAGIPDGDFNGRFLTYINLVLGSAYQEINGAMAAFAASGGAASWAGAGAGTFPQSPTGFIFLKGADGAYLKGADGAYLLGVAP